MMSIILATLNCLIRKFIWPQEAGKYVCPLLMTLHGKWWKNIVKVISKHVSFLVIVKGPIHIACSNGLIHLLRAFDPSGYLPQRIISIFKWRKILQEVFNIQNFMFFMEFFYLFYNTTEITFLPRISCSLPAFPQLPFLIVLVLIK